MTQSIERPMPSNPDVIELDQGTLKQTNHDPFQITSRSFEIWQRAYFEEHFVESDISLFKCLMCQIS